MSTVEAGHEAARRAAQVGPAVLHAARHPDQRWLTRVQAAIDWWAGSPYESSPTSSLTAGGAIAAAEREFGRLHPGRSGLLLPSATYGLRLALQTLGVGAGDDVLLPAVDWPASGAAVRSLAARPVLVPVDPVTLTIDAAAAAAVMGDRARAVIACHLHGICADIPALRRALPGLPVVEDCAGALGSTLDGVPAGSLGDLAVFSFGPGKSVDAGEGGLLLAATASLHERALRLATHPIRQVLAGIEEPIGHGFGIRPHPVMAVLLLHALATLDVDGCRAAYQAAVRTLSGSGPWMSDGYAVLGADGRRSSAQPRVPVRADIWGEWSSWSPSGAEELLPEYEIASPQVPALLSTVRLAPVAEVVKGA